MAKTSVYLRSCVCALAVAAAADMAQAQSAQAQSTYTPPPGIVEEGPVYRWDGSSVPFIHNGAEANNYVRVGPPTEPFLSFGASSMVNTQQPLQFVRLYTSGTESGPVGTWVMRSDVIRGLTPAQLRDLLALPYTPDSWVIVRVPAHTCLLSGIAGPIMGGFPAAPGPNGHPAGPWGHGGGEQTKIIGVTGNPGCSGAQPIPAGSYVHQQALTEHALWYEYTAGAGNKQAVAYALDHLPPVTPYGDMYNVYGALDYLNYGDPQPLQSALTQLAGQTYADFATVEIKSAEVFVNALFNRMTVLRGGAADGEPAARFWGGALGGWGGVSSESDGVLELNYNMAGGVAGFDRRLDATARAGAALAYVRSSLSEREGADSGSLDAWMAAAYGSLGQGALHLDAALGYAYNSGELNRLISFPDVFRTATGSPNANSFLGAVEGGYEIGLNAFIKTAPFVRLQSVSIRQESMAESGAGAIDLAIASRSANSFRSVTGVLMEAAFDPRSPDSAKIRARLGWAHEYAGTEREVEASFEGGPGGAFIVQGARLPADSLIVQITASASVSENCRLFADYNGDISERGSFSAITGGVRIAW